MNSLSWFIWLTQIFSTLHDSLPMILFIETILIAIGMFFGFIIATDLERDDIVSNVKKIFKWYLLTFIPLLLLYTIVPSQQTMILIASSEVGQRVVSSQEFQDNVKGVVDPGAELLKTWIKSETEKLKDNLEKKSDSK